jgi:hypothetical protein
MRTRYHSPPGDSPPSLWPSCLRPRSFLSQPSISYPLYSPPVLLRATRLTIPFCTLQRTCPQSGTRGTQNNDHKRNWSGGSATCNGCSLLCMGRIVLKRSCEGRGNTFDKQTNTRPLTISLTEISTLESSCPLPWLPFPTSRALIPLSFAASPASLSPVPASPYMKAS